MTERVINVEVLEERIAVCSQCLKKNRLHQRSGTGVYRCGVCRAVLRNPFLTPAKQPVAERRMFGYVGASVIGLLVLAAVIVGFTSFRRSPVNKLSKNNRSALSPVRPIGQVDSGETKISAPAQPTVVANPPAIPRSRPETEIPINNAILFNAIPESTAQGRLMVSNGSSRHAVARLIDSQSDKKILSFVVCAGQQSTIDGIGDGSYRLIFAFGDRLYRATDRFESSRGFSKFDKLLTFTKTATEGGSDHELRDPTLSVTLTPVVGSEVTTSRILRDEFDKY